MEKSVLLFRDERICSQAGRDPRGILRLLGMLSGEGCVCIVHAGKVARLPSALLQECVCVCLSVPVVCAKTREGSRLNYLLCLTALNCFEPHSVY